MPFPAPEAGVDSGLLTRAGAIPGVEHASLDESSATLWLVCASAPQSASAASAARALLATEPSFARYAVRTAIRTEGQGSGRLRFIGVERLAGRDNQVRVRVTLEWGGERLEEEASGESGEAIVLRTAATAMLAAVHRFAGWEFGVRLAGIKHIRAFDADLTVASLYRPGEPSLKLVGAVVSGDDPCRAACLAVLNALNRLLGNYLANR
jgi:hypothetical protein